MTLNTKYVTSTVPSVTTLKPQNSPVSKNINVSILQTAKLRPRVRAGLAGGLAAVLEPQKGPESSSPGAMPHSAITFPPSYLWQKEAFASGQRACNTLAPRGAFFTRPGARLGRAAVKLAFMAPITVLTNVFPAAVAESRLMSPWP